MAYLFGVRKGASSTRMYSIRVVFYLIVAFVILLLPMLSQAAELSLKVKLINEDASPVELLKAEGSLSIYDESKRDRLFNAQSGSVRYFNNRNSRSGFPYWEGNIRYRNKSKQQIKSVTFILKFLDESGKTISYFKSTVKRDLPPGREYSYQWNDMVSGSAIKSAVVRTSEVEFANDILWVSKENKEHEDAIFIALRAERARLKAIYEEKGVERMLEMLYR